MLLEPSCRLEASLTDIALKELAHQAVRVGDMPVSVIFSLESRRAVRTGEFALAGVRRAHVFAQKTGLEETFGTHGATVT